MKKVPPILVIALCVTGILSGLGARRLASPRLAPQNQAAETTAEPDIPSAPPVAEISHRRSTDTIETLTGLSASSLYPRLALWLMDSDEEDIAAYWDIYQKGKTDDDITLLIFLRWVRLNPHAAIAAAGTDNLFRAWRAWACHDPQGSLAAAITLGDDETEAVAFGLGEFHPAWLRLHFHEIPESVRDVAMDGMSQWDDTENPQETLRFMEENEGYLEPGQLKALARQDPWAALEWAERSSRQSYSYSSIDDAPALVIATLAKERPEDLKRIEAQTPSGELKLQMAAALFENLVKSDPSSALDQARSATTPGVAASRFAALGQSMVHSDPEQALEFAKDLLSACPDALSAVVKIEYPESEREFGFEIPGVREFAKSLMATDPAGFMDQVVILFSADPNSLYRFNNLSNSWAEEDLPAYTNWLDQQTDEITRKRGASIISDRLQQTGNFEEAAEWATVNISDNSSPMIELITTWKNTAPGAPEKWLESAKLTDEQRAFIHHILAAPR